MLMKNLVLITALLGATVAFATEGIQEAPFEWPKNIYDNPVKSAIAKNQMSYGTFLMANSVENAVNLSRRAHFLWIDAETVDNKNLSFQARFFFKSFSKRATRSSRVSSYRKISRSF